MKIHNRSIQKTQKGIRRQNFTVLEMLVAMALLSIILYSLVMMLDQTQKTMEVGLNKITVAEQARLILDMMENDLNTVDIKTTKTFGDETVGWLEVGKVSSHKGAFSINSADSKGIAGGEAFRVFSTRTSTIPMFCMITYYWHDYRLYTRTVEQPNLRGATKQQTLLFSEYESDDRNAVNELLMDGVYIFRVTGTLSDDELDTDAERDVYDAVTIEVGILDDTTLRLGWTADNNPSVKDYDPQKAIARIEGMTNGKKLLEERCHRFSRRIFLNLEAM